MSPETLGTVGRPLLSEEAFVQLSNRFAEESLKMGGPWGKSYASCCWSVNQIQSFLGQVRSDYWLQDRASWPLPMQNY